jgi:two-component system, NtrC family, response regulator AtoC
MTPPLILVVDDDESALKALMQVLRRENYHVEGASSGPEALQRLDSSPADLVITDIRMGRMDGMELMRELHARRPNLPVIVMTAFASIDTAIRSIHEGAYDYISKPYEVDDLRLTVRRALEQARLASENVALRQNLAEDKERDVQMIGMSPQMIEVYKMIARVAPTGATVLIDGESGSGKELIARAIHANSERRSEQFVALNCGAVTETLLETELFGHVKGAFTGASFAKQGLFEAANKGTIFLDEIGETSPHMQTRLLRVLEEREIQRVGSVERTPVDIRVIAATNRPLLQLVSRGKFREDLYYRLNVVAITVPPLRERLTDLPLLFDHFLKRHRRETRRTIAVHGDVLDMLRQYTWPGNVRELENMVERAVTLNTSGVLTTADFAEHVKPSGEPVSSFPAELVSLEEIERRYTAHVIARCNGNMTRAAEILQIDRRTLYRMLERFAQRNAEVSADKPVG